LFRLQQNRGEKLTFFLGFSKLLLAARFPLPSRHLNKQGGNRGGDSFFVSMNALISVDQTLVWSLHTEVTTYAI